MQAAENEPEMGISGCEEHVYDIDSRVNSDLNSTPEKITDFCESGWPRRGFVQHCRRRRLRSGQCGRREPR